MPAASAGNILFSKVVAFKETTPGTSAISTSGGRKSLTSATGIISLNQEWDLGEDRSVALRNPIVAGGSTLISSEPEVSLEVPAISVGELPVWFSGMDAATITGASAPYTWDFKPVMTNTSNSPTSYSLQVGDGQQAYAVTYVLPTELSIKADRSGLTSLSVSAFAQAVAKDSTATTEGVPTSPFLSGRLWKPYVYTNAAAFAADITTSTIPTGGTAYNYVLDFDLKINTGLTEQAYLAGTTAFVTHAESAAIGGDVSLTVQSNASAVTTWYDAIGSAKYLRLEHNGAGNYPVNIQVAFIVTDVQVIAGDEDGLTTYSVTGTLAYDATSAATLRVILKSDLAALP